MYIFLATDIESSTRLWEKFPHDMPAALAQHDALIHKIIEQHGGKIVKHTGDGLFAIFEAGSALASALEIQVAISSASWGALGSLRVRVAVHAGPAEQRGQDFFGLEVTRTFRLLSAGWGGQILASAAGLAACIQPPDCTLIDHGEQLLRDLSQPQQIFELRSVIASAQQFPRLRTLTSLPNNIPVPPTPFLGRENELAEIAHLMAKPNCRLLTVTGPGGMGKTRLAIQSAANLSVSFPQGVFFVPLSILTGVDQFIPAIATAVGLSFFGNSPPRTQLFNYLREQKLLLILDNFEHLMDSADELGEIIDAAPKIKVIATSRERLNLQGEWVLEISGMTAPPSSNVKNVEDYPAYELFLETAQRSTPGFSPNPSEQACIVHICNTLEGMPLGIELAAAWANMLSCQEIAKEINSNLDFLNTRMRNVPQRHRSLRAAFDYSWNLLQVEEQQILACLSIFSGDFNRHSAESIASATLPVLTDLVDKSLLQKRRSPNGENTYRIHIALRQFAKEQLSHHPEQSLIIHQRHAEFFLNLLAAQTPALKSAGQIRALDLIADALADIRQAWAWACSHMHEDLVSNSLQALSEFYSMRNRHQEYLAQVRQALSGLTESPNQSLLLRLHLELSKVYLNLHQNASAKALLDTSLLQACQLKLPAIECIALCELGVWAWYEGQYDNALEYQTQALALARVHSDQRFIAKILDSIGIIHWASGSTDLAHQYFFDALDIIRQVGDPYSTAQQLDHIGVVLRDLRRYSEARPYLEEALSAFEYIDAPQMLALVHNHLSGVLIALGEEEAGLSHLSESIRLARRLGEQRSLAYGLADTASIYLQLNRNLESVRDNLNQALELFRQATDSFGEIYVRVTLAECDIRANELDQAWENLKMALRPAYETGSNGWVSAALVLMARILCTRKNTSLAFELVELATQTGSNTLQYIDEANEIRTKCLATLDKMPAVRPLSIVIKNLLS